MFKFFRRLQWKLTLSYAVVTAGTVIVLTVLFIGIAAYFETQNSTRTFDSFYWSKTAFQDNIPYLIDEPQALQEWLERVQQMMPGLRYFWDSDRAVSTMFGAAGPSGYRAHTLVLDRRLRVLAAFPFDDRPEEHPLNERHEVEVEPPDARPQRRLRERAEHDPGHRGERHDQHGRRQ